MKTARDLLIEKLREIGADGVCHCNCGCGLDDFEPCSEININLCVPAKKISKESDECKAITVTWLSDGATERCLDMAYGKDCRGHCYTPMDKPE